MKKLFNFLGFLFQASFVVILIFNLIKTGEIEDPGFWDYAYIIVDIIIMIPLVSYMAVEHLITFIMYTIRDVKKELIKLEEQEIKEEKEKEEKLKQYDLQWKIYKEDK